MPLDLARQTILRWRDPEPGHIPLLEEASVEAVVLDNPPESFERACRAAGIAVAPNLALAGIVADGLWPGIRSGPNVEGRGDETASASREPWVDANGYLVAVERALRPSRPAVLGYLPDARAGLAPDRMVPFETLELALVEARVSGGNYILALDPRYREALVRRDPKALAAWRRLGRTAVWLKQNADLFGRPVIPAITALIDDRGSTHEIANLLYRRNASPALAPAGAPPAPAPERILALVAAGIQEATPDLRARILRHAEAGAIVVFDSAPDRRWKLLRQQSDRNFYSYGKGQIVAYHEPITDPSEFALDVIDLITHRRRAARLWNAPAVIPMATRGRRPGEALLHVVNYGARQNQEIQARIQGHFERATLLRPDGEATRLATACRGSTTEVFLPELDRVGVVVFS